MMQTQRYGAMLGSVDGVGVGVGVVGGGVHLPPTNLKVSHS